MSDVLKTQKDYLLLFGKGVAMGAADVVPGVSGGTIAFVTGIYARLLAALTTFTPKTLALLWQKRKGISAVWQAIDGWFLLTLFLGIVTSILSLAKVINYLLEMSPIAVWSFFIGLVIASIVYLVKQIPQLRWREYAAIALGTIIAVTISLLRPAQLPDTWWMMALSGFIAICAMILPGISGSFILLMMGMYKVFIQALISFNWLFLASFGLGCVTGLLVFSHLLSFLLHHYYSVMMALLTGFLVGSLNVLWPWKEIVETTVDRHGETIPLVQQNILPWTYESVTGNNAQLRVAILITFVGFLIVFFLERMGDQKTS